MNLNLRLGRMRPGMALDQQRLRKALLVECGRGYGIYPLPVFENRFWGRA